MVQSMNVNAAGNEIGTVSYTHLDVYKRQVHCYGYIILLSMVGCGRIEGASVQDLSNTKDAICLLYTSLLRLWNNRAFYMQ